MDVKTATKLAKAKSRRTIGNWYKIHPDLARRIGKRIHIDEERFFNMVTNGTGLLDWEQTKIYAASLVGDHYLCAHDTFMFELERLIPNSVEWFRRGGGYWSSACVDWRQVSRLCYEHQATADEVRQERAKRGLPC